MPIFTRMCLVHNTLLLLLLLLMLLLLFSLRVLLWPFVELAVFVATVIVVVSREGNVDCLG